MKEERIDLSALDPARDLDRWQARLDQVAARARALPRRKTVAYQLRAWAGPALAIAASLAIVSWAGALARGQDAQNTSAASEVPAYELSQLAAGGETPSAAKLLRVLGESHVAK